MRGFLVLVLLAFFGPLYPVFANSVPITVEDDLFGTLPFTERRTCDPEFMKVMNSRSWMSAQREITQNGNIVPRPDSVLTYSCFDQFMLHQSFYADRNFPGDPDQSKGGFGGIFNDVAVGPIEFVAAGDPLAPSIAAAAAPGTLARSGFIMFAALEILVLDQLVDVGSIIGLGEDAIISVNGSVNAGAACVPVYGTSTFKQNYLQDGFTRYVLGDRAPQNVAFTSLPADNIGTGTQYNCEMMSRVWNAARCYNFAQQSDLYVEDNQGGNHDGFYSLADYKTLADSGGDYRTLAGACEAPNDDILKLPDPLQLVCDAVQHGFPSVPSLSALATEAAGIDSPTWGFSMLAANPDVGAAGAVEGVGDYMDFMRGSCAPPRKLGYIVIGPNGNPYVNAVCPTLGCRFNPPNSLSGTGTCYR